MKNLDRLLSWMSIFAAALTVSLVVGVIGFNEFSKHELTVFVQLEANEDPFLVIPQMVPLNSRVTEVQTLDKDDNKYALKVTTTQPRKRLLEIILGNKKVKDAQIKDIN